ncbi:MAG: extracellular solute-binding protein [Azospirillaceae bacterium]|nr:extracellular solute-binding protein [Azospirillaceae bacterium]
MLAFAARHLPSPRRWLVRNLLISGLMATTAIPAAGIAAATDNDTVTLYNGQHEQAVGLLVADFEKRTGITVRVHSGEAPEIANQLAEEGRSSPADVYFTENSPELALLEEKGLLAPVAAATLAEVPAQYNSPKGDWVGVLARESVLAYNTAQVAVGALPASLLDLAKPAWQGKVGIAPSDGDFLPLVSAVAALKGQDVALAWLRGLEKNAQTFDDDEGVVAAVNRGAVATGVVNNYYWARLRQQNGPAGMHSAVYHFMHGDVGGLVNISGAAALAAAPHPEAAQRFLAYLVSEPAQALLATTDIIFEYPLRPGVAASPLLKPLDQLQPPAIGISELGDDANAAPLLRQAGLL